MSGLPPEEHYLTTFYDLWLRFVVGHTQHSCNKHLQTFFFIFIKKRISNILNYFSRVFCFQKC